MTDDLDFYDLLGVDRDASREEIRTAFRGQVREYHPDLNDDPRAPAQFTALKKAYDTLADPNERDAYDRMGHDEYVSKRINRLPSADQWQVPDRDDAGDSTGATVERSSRGTAGSKTATGTSRTSASETGGSGAESGTSTGGSSRTTASGGGDQSGGGVGGSTGRSTASTSGSTGGSTTESAGQSNVWGSRSNGDGESGRRSVTGSRGKTAATGAGSARSPEAAPDPTASASTASEETSTATTSAGSAAGTVEPESGDSDRSDGERVGWSVRQWFRQANLGWPLIVLADVMYLAGMSTYLVTNSEGIERLVSALARAGANPDAVVGVVAGSTRYGIGTLPAFVRAELSHPNPTGAALVLAGLAFLPSVYLFIIHETRRTRTPWQPSYLYVVGALAPILGVVLTLLVGPAGLSVEVVCYVVLPVATMVGLPASAFVRPWVLRRVRRVWWKITG